MPKPSIASAERCVECGTRTTEWVGGWDGKKRCLRDAAKGPRADGSPRDDVSTAVEHVLREWERADLTPEGAGVRRGMALEIRLAMKRAAATA